MISNKNKKESTYFSDLTELEGFYPYKIASVRIYYSV